MAYRRKGINGLKYNSFSKNILTFTKFILNCYVNVSIMNFNKTTSYSLKVLDYMARNTKERMSASFLFKKLNIPYSYLRQVLSDLSKHGFIKGYKGRNGGFVLAKDSSDIFLSDIVDSSEGLDSFERCIMGYAKCPFNNPCPLHQTWSEARNEIMGILKSTSLNELLKIETETN